MATLGVLALQGGFSAHVAMLASIGHRAREVRYAADLDAIDGLALPGGESTAMLKLVERAALWDALDRFAASGRPILATCAGLILAARTVLDPAQPSFGWLPVTVRRNAWGRQVDSFTATADDAGIPLVFIRAPRIADPGDAEVVLRYRGEPVLVRKENVFGATFHPELTRDAGIHRRVFG